jgi:hypothetical protein
MHSEIEEFHLEVPEVALVDLQARLARTRWPERQTVDGSEQGLPLRRCAPTGVTTTTGGAAKRG